MSEFFFVLKTLGITVGLILLLQVRVGQTTIEQRSLRFMHESAAIEALRGVADGAVTVGIEGSSWVQKKWKQNFGGGESSSKERRHSNERRSKSQQHSWAEETHEVRGEEVD